MEQRKSERRGRVNDDRRVKERRRSDRRRGDRRAGQRRALWCGVCRTQLTPQGYCPTCRVRIVSLRP
ncbi:MAG: hypothetical protein AB1515_01895 [Nitrospirota bacterium]